MRSYPINQKRLTSQDPTPIRARADCKPPGPNEPVSRLSCTLKRFRPPSPLPCRRSPGSSQARNSSRSVDPTNPIIRPQITGIQIITCVTNQASRTALAPALSAQEKRTQLPSFVQLYTVMTRIKLLLARPRVGSLSQEFLWADPLLATACFHARRPAPGPGPWRSWRLSHRPASQPKANLLLDLLVRNLR